MFCPNCGTQADDNAMICTNCGATLNQSFTDPAPQTVDTTAQPVDNTVPAQTETPVYAQSPDYNNQGYTDPNAQYNQGYTDPNAQYNQGYTDPNAQYNQGYTDPNAQYNQNNNTAYNAAGGQQKSKMVAGLLGIFLGAWGIHNFYIGKTTRAIIQIIVTIVTCGVGGIWGFIEGILILCGVNGFNTDANGVPLSDQ